MQNFCKKCETTMDVKNFYKKKDGSYMDLCKKCATMHLNVFIPDSYMWLCKELDIPYIEAEWNKTVNKDYLKKGEITDHGAVFGKYVSKMKLGQWGKLGWADTERLKEEQEKNLEAAKLETEEYQKELEEKFKNGEISEYEYKTLATTAKLQLEEADQMTTIPLEYVQQNGGKFVQNQKNKKVTDVVMGDGNMSFYNEEEFMSEDELPDVAAELTKEDKIYLAMKWGRLYKPAEWVELEKQYDKFAKAFEVDDPDTTSSLILICKTYLKMNQAIDAGDDERYQKLSRVYESMRKSAKFMAVQNKEAKGDVVDCIGSLIVLCEKDGFIPQYATDIPQDKVDFTLRDMEKYNYKLVTQDLGFGDQIENAIKNLQLKKESEEAENLIEDKEIAELGDKDIIEYYDELEAQRLVDMGLETSFDEEPEEEEGYNGTI